MVALQILLIFIGLLLVAVGLLVSYFAREIFVLIMFAKMSDVVLPTFRQALIIFLTGNLITIFGILIAIMKVG